MSRRLRFRTGLHRLYLPVYDFLSENLAPEWEPVRGFITFEEQQARFDIGRSTPGRPVTYDKAGESPYNYGCASAWTIFVQGKPVWDLPPSEWAYFADMVEKAGGLWGGRFQTGRDRAHNELRIRKDWSEVNKARLLDGMKGANKFIEGNMVR